jgi:hypothetical protein
VRSTQLDRSSLDRVDRGDPVSNFLSLKGAGRHLSSLATMVAIQSLETVPVSLQKHIAHLESQLRILVEKQAITDLNSYAEETINAEQIHRIGPEDGKGISILTPISRTPSAKDTAARKWENGLLRP